MIDAGRLTVGNAVQPLKALLIIVFIAGMVMVVNAVQPEKVESSIPVRDAGRVTEVNFVAPLNALDPNLVTVLGITTLVTVWFPSNALL